MTEKPLHLSEETLAEMQQWVEWEQRRDEDDRRGHAAALRLSTSSQTPKQLCADFDALIELLGAPMPFAVEAGFYYCPVCRTRGDYPESVEHAAWCRWKIARAAFCDLM